MYKLFRQVFIEVLWLTISLGLTTVSALFLFGRTFLANAIDIHLYDTYFVIAPLHVLVPMFFLVTFIIYFVKEFRNSFKRTLQNWILLILGLTLVFGLTFLIKTISLSLTSSWTSYPPLSALEPDKVPELTQDPVSKFLTILFTVVQVLVLAMSLFAVFRWGTQKQKEVNA